MQREVISTEDGSSSIRVGELTYHSVHGAITESMHVFIRAGLEHWLNMRRNHGVLLSPMPEADEKMNAMEIQQPTIPVIPVRIFEMGFGTGLNALLTYIEATERKIPVHYTTIELFPLSGVEARRLNYPEELNRPELAPYFHEMHDAAWEANGVISPYFTLHKIKGSLEELVMPDAVSHNPGQTGLIDLVYFDAFAPTAQPELWTEAVFRKLAGWMARDAVLVTYCSKGDVQRAMKAAGLNVGKIQGPPFKREMVRAMKE